MTCDYEELHLLLALAGLALTAVGAYFCGVLSELRAMARANREEHRAP